MEVSKTEYKGNPMVSFSEGTDDRYPFSFGKSKAAKFVKGILENGLRETLSLIQEVADDSLSPEENAELNELLNSIVE